MTAAAVASVAKRRIANVRRVFRDISPLLIGSAFIRLWVRLAAPAMSVGIVPLGFTAENVFDASCAATALLLAFIAGRRRPLHRQDELLSVATVGLLVASALLALAFAGAPWAYIPAAIIGAFGFMTMSLAWCSLYMSFNPMRLVLYYCIARLVSIAAQFMLIGCGKPQLVVALFVCAYGSLRTLNASVHNVAPDDRPISEIGSRPFPWKLALFMTTCEIASIVARNSGGVLSPLPALLATAVPPLIFVCGVVTEPRKFTLRGIYLLASLVMACALLLPIALPTLPRAISTALVSMGYNTAGILGVLIAGSLSYRLGISSVWILGITKACTYTGMFLGSVLYNLLATPQASLSPRLATITAICVLISSCLLLSEHGLSSNWHMAPAQMATDAMPDETRTRLAAVTRARDIYGLTDREEEILYLLAQHKKVPTIAKDMFIAQGTVKAHVQHIYQKMGVHSRTELEHALGVSEHSPKAR